MHTSLVWWPCETRKTTGPTHSLAGSSFRCRFLLEFRVFWICYYICKERTFLLLIFVFLPLCIALLLLLWIVRPASLRSWQTWLPLSCFFVLWLCFPQDSAVWIDRYRIYSQLFLTSCGEVLPPHPPYLICTRENRPHFPRLSCRHWWHCIMSWESWLILGWAFPKCFNCLVTVCLCLCLWLIHPLVL